jgi:hypothetical protein
MQVKIVELHTLLDTDRKKTSALLENGRRGCFRSRRWRGISRRSIAQIRATERERSRGDSAHALSLQAALTEEQSRSKSLQAAVAKLSVGATAAAEAAEQRSRKRRGGETDEEAPHRVVEGEGPAGGREKRRRVSPELDASDAGDGDAGEGLGGQRDSTRATVVIDNTIAVVYPNTIYIYPRTATAARAVSLAHRAAQGDAGADLAPSQRDGGDDEDDEEDCGDGVAMPTETPLPAPRRRRPPRPPPPTRSDIRTVIKQ